MRGLGLVFDIDGLGNGYYGDRAWRIFMKHVNSRSITGCSLEEGDLQRHDREYCIAIRGVTLDVRSIAKVFSGLNEKGLALPDRRLLSESELERAFLVPAGRIDPVKRFVEPSWTRISHDRCKDCGWGYCPRQIPDDLPPNIRSELHKMMEISL